MAIDFLQVLKRHGLDQTCPTGNHGAPAAQGQAPASRDQHRHPRGWDFAFATGVECSNPVIVDETGKRTRRDLLEECGHYQHWRTDLHLVKEMGIPCLRYGLPSHLVHLGPDRYDWSFADEALGEIRRLGITPILDLCHFGIPDWMGDFQNPEMPVHFGRYAGAVAARYPWVRGYTPVNEIYVAARNSGWDGIWNERLRTERGFVTAMKHLVAANLLAAQEIVRVRPNAIIVQSESAEYTHHVSAAPSHAVKLRNKLVFLSLDLLYSKAPDSDVLLFLFDNGMTREEFMWFMRTPPSGYQVMGNDYYGHNEKLMLPDGTITDGEDVLGWYHRDPALLPPLLQAGDAHRDEHLRPRRPRRSGCGKEWTNVLRMRRDGIPVLGFTWYS
jgi:beta-glucosidase/6-phospho-beta-glucosidase/beta-galactosidase